MKRRLFAGFIAITVAGMVLAGCAPGNQTPQGFHLSSSNFRDGGIISQKYTCEGDDISPPLAWAGMPAGTQSLALIMEDRDAPGGVFTHWVIFNLLPSTLKLSEAVPQQTELPTGARQGQNDFGKLGYGGPCPASASYHHYQFTLYALDQTLQLAGGTTRQQLEAAMSGHVLGEARLTGICQHFCCEIE